MPEVNKNEWDEFLSTFPNSHLLQTSEWGELKNGFGWEVVRVRAGEAGAQILFYDLPIGYSWAYIPKGPVGKASDAFWPEVDTICKQRRAVFLKVEPDFWQGHEAGGGAAIPDGFIPSKHAIQPLRTMVVDISEGDASILARMKQKTRYNVRLAKKKGVTVHRSNDIEGFYRLMEITGARDAFGIHSIEYYQKAYDLFNPIGRCALLRAELEGESLAEVMVFVNGERAWYLFGVSSGMHKNRMPNYAVQWEAMRWAREQGCTKYDFWGVPDENLDTLEANFTQRNDGLWGVYRFKRGFGGELHRAAGPWDRVYNPALYAIYRWWGAIRW